MLFLLILLVQAPFCLILIAGRIPKPDDKIAVLLYHHILNDSENVKFKDNPCVVSTENFEKQMKYLYDNGYHTITLQELEDFLFNQKILPKKSVLINFDDGYYSNVVRAYPILKKYGFRATVFMITSVSPQTQEAFNPDRLQFIAEDTIEATDSVFEYAGHSHNMHELIGDKTGLVLKTAEEIKADTEKSFEIVSNHKVFAYPRGQYNNVSIEGLKSAGIKIALTVKEGYVKRNQNPMELKRFIIFPNTSFDRFKKIVSGV